MACAAAIASGVESFGSSPLEYLTAPTTGINVMSKRSPIPVPLRCVCENPMTVESLEWYPEHQSHDCGMLVGPSCTAPNGTLAPTNTCPCPPEPILTLT